MTNPKHTDTSRSGDLVERFNRFLSEWGRSRQYGDVIYGLHVGTDREVELTATSLREAATTLEAFEAEIERFEQAMGQRMMSYLNHIEALEAKAERWREALQRIAIGDGIGGPDAELQCADIATAALGEK